jgi:hypothetical protein
MPNTSDESQQKKLHELLTKRIKWLLANITLDDSHLSLKIAKSILDKLDPTTTVNQSHVRYALKTIKELFDEERLKAVAQLLALPIPPIHFNSALVLPLRQFSDDLAQRRRGTPTVDEMAIAFAETLYKDGWLPKSGTVFLGNGTTVYQVAQWMATTEHFKDLGVVTTNFEIAALLYYHQHQKKAKVRRLVLGSEQVEFNTGCVIHAGNNLVHDTAIISFHTFRNGVFFSRDTETAKSNNQAILAANRIALVAESIKVGAPTNAGIEPPLELPLNKTIHLITDKKSVWENCPEWHKRWASITIKEAGSTPTGFTSPEPNGPS